MKSFEIIFEGYIFTSHSLLKLNIVLSKLFGDEIRILIIFQFQKIILLVLNLMLQFDFFFVAEIGEETENGHIF